MQIFFDLEGPLSPQDNAYEVLGIAENGEKVFEVISKYDDILTLEERPNYEPGDTLKLIVPFLIFHNISEEDVGRVSKRAKIVAGVKEVVSSLKEEGWQVYIISTSYQQHALNIAGQVGVEKGRVACTKMPLDDYISKLGKEDFALVEEVEDKILRDLHPRMDEGEIVKTLDEFFFGRLQDTGLGRIFNEVTVIGGQRKVEAMKGFMQDDFSKVVAVGDSITDFKMLKKVKEEGGLAIVFNGNEYAIPFASVALASVDQRFLLPITSAFMRGGRDEAVNLARELETADFDSILSYLPGEIAESVAKETPRYHCLEGASQGKIQEVIKIHKEYRMLVRGEAGKLG